MQRSSARRWIVAAAVAALLVAIAARLSASRDDLAQLQRLSADVVLGAVAFQFGSQLLFNGAMLRPLRDYVAALGYWEFFLVRTGGFVAGAIVPVAGNIAVRLAYLRRRGVGYAEFAWATLVSNVVALAAAAAIAAVATGLLWARTGPPPFVVLGLAAAVAAGGIGAVLVTWAAPGIAGHHSLRRWRSLSAMSRFTLSRRTAGEVFAFSLVRHALNFATFGLLYQSLSRLPGDFLTGGLVYALTSPVRIVAITPGNIGVIEWVVALVGRSLAFDVTTGLLVALLFRAVTILAQAAGVLVGWAWLAAWGKA